MPFTNPWHQSQQAQARMDASFNLGDTVELEDGQKKRIVSITNGMIRGHKMLTFADGDWTHVPARAALSKES